MLDETCWTKRGEHVTAMTAYFCQMASDYVPGGFSQKGLWWGPSILWMWLLCLLTMPPAQNPLTGAQTYLWHLLLCLVHLFRHSAGSIRHCSSITFTGKPFQTTLFRIALSPFHHLLDSGHNLFSFITFMTTWNCIKHACVSSQSSSLERKLHKDRDLGHFTHPYSSST